MTRMEVITLDSGLLGRALWPLNNIWFVAWFLFACLLFACASYLWFQLSSDPFLVWSYVSTLSAAVMCVGAALFVLLAVSFGGLFLVPIENQRTNLYHINRTIRSRLHRSKKWGPVTRATLFAAALFLCIAAAGFVALLEWNRRAQPGISAITAAVFGFTVVLAVFLYFLPALKQRLYFRRHGSNNGANDFILLLRSFNADALHTKVRAFTRPYSIEDMVADMLERFTNVIAVSDPRDAMQPVGAERIALKTKDWQPRVLELMDRAAAIVMVLDRSPGVIWELERIMEKGRLSKTVFVVWAPEGGWLEGAWTELLDRIGGRAVAVGFDKHRNQIALAATCSKHLIRIAAASTHTPLNCGLAVSTLLYLSVFGDN